MSRSSREVPEPEAVLVVRGPRDAVTSMESPRSWVPVVMALLFGLALGLLFGSGFDVPPVEESQPPAASSTTVPGPASVSLVQEFAAALAAGDPQRIAALLDEEPVVLQLPGWAGFPILGAGHLTPSGSDPSVIDETAGLVAGLGFRLKLTDCHSRPLSERGAELYDEIVACSFVASDRLSERLGWGPETGQMDLGVRKGCVRAAFTTASSSSTADAWPPLWVWVQWFRPHLDVHWLSAWESGPVDGGEFAEVLLDAASDYATWIEEQGGISVIGEAAPPAPRPEGGTGPTYRTGHVMVFDPVTDRVLLLGGATTPESSNSWGLVPDPRIWAFDYAARTWTVWKEHQLYHEAASYDLESGLLVVISGEWDGGWGTEPLLTSVLTHAASTGVWDEKKSIPAELRSGWGWRSYPHRAVYEAGSDRVVVADRDEGLWAYDVDGDAWVELQPASPSQCDLFGKRMAYDAGADRIVLSGQGELCVYDLDTNTLIARPRGGAPDEVSATAYDEDAGLVVILGDGFVWAYHTPSGLLEQIGPIADGVLWRNAAMVYHPTSDRMVVFDGARTWGYHLDSDEWVQLEP